MTLKLQFDPNQPYQHDAVESVARLDTTLSDEAKVNLADRCNLKVI